MLLSELHIISAVNVLPGTDSVQWPWALIAELL